MKSKLVPINQLKDWYIKKYFIDRINFFQLLIKVDKAKREVRKWIS